MIWLMKILRICMEEQLLIKYYMINRLILQEIKKKKKHGYQRDFASVDYNFFDKKYSSGAITSKHELDKELHKPIRKFEKQNVHSFVEDNNWGVIMQVYN